MGDSYLVQLFLSILIMMGLLLVVLSVTKKIQRKRYSGNMTVKDRLSVDNGVALMIVDIRGKEYLVSVGGRNVRLLKELDQDVLAA
jgi:flagellar biogenesis protein FliO